MAQSLTVCAPKCMPSPQIGLMMKTLNTIVKRAVIAMFHVTTPQIKQGDFSEKISLP
jgi:hypothetical protein